jgi:hypothetical protein
MLSSMDEGTSSRRLSLSLELDYDRELRSSIAGNQLPSIAALLQEPAVVACSEAEAIQWCDQPIVDLEDLEAGVNCPRLCLS